ncbi:hypothetical protein YA0783_00510 [Pseudomonas corrugata]|jgi:hypothetical protein|uniref:hypothetical protein n=1 Tax=Pseudomonas corrugata TaxID=47879 RepID=UPI0018E6480C|nr:hypothetical protein [Pseudomonas corrugata]MBI6616766.1 hypothetical protein [Pseudomonas corrugata]MBI6694474.1 hypothetical protein [Pseudomonas corrugata]
MNKFGYDFTSEQRRVLDRYINFLSTVHLVFDKIPVVFERRRMAGHQATALVADSRLNNAYFNVQSLLTLGMRVNEIKVLSSAHDKELKLFRQEALEITARTSRREPLAEVDYRLFSFSRAERWTLSPPKCVEDLIHELYLRSISIRSAIRQMVFKLSEVNQESFGVNAVFRRAMDHRSCQCHDQPTVVQALFQEASITPPWDLDYLSKDASGRAAEYKADIGSLFNAFSNLNSHLGLVAQTLYQGVDNVVLELQRASYAQSLGELNIRLNTANRTFEEGMILLDDFDRWLRT